MASETIALSGKAYVAHGGNKEHNARAKFATGDKVFLVVEGTVRAFEESESQSSGKETKLKARLDEATVLTGADEKEFRQILADQRRVREDKVDKDQGRLEVVDDYTGLNKQELVDLCKERGLAIGNRSKAELADLLRANDG